MTDAEPAQTVAPLSLPARMLGVITSPSATFANVAAYPKWFGVLAISLLVLAAANYVFLSTPIGQQASLDQQVTQIEGFGQTVDDAMYEQLKGRMKYTAAISAVAILVASPVITVVFAAVSRAKLAWHIGSTSASSSRISFQVRPPSELRATVRRFGPR